jgi:hypothetical protein
MRPQHFVRQAITLSIRGLLCDLKQGRRQNRERRIRQSLNSKFVALLGHRIKNYDMLVHDDPFLIVEAASHRLGALRCQVTATGRRHHNQDSGIYGLF